MTPSGTKIAHELSDLADFGGVSVDELRPVSSRSASAGSCVRSRRRRQPLRDLPRRARRAGARHAHGARGRPRALAGKHGVRPAAPAPTRGAGSRSAACSSPQWPVLPRYTPSRSGPRGPRPGARGLLSSRRNPPQGSRSTLSEPSLAREAARLYPSETAEEALRTALIQSRVRTVVDVGEPLLGAVLERGRRVRRQRPRGRCSWPTAAPARRRARRPARRLGRSRSPRTASHSSPVRTVCCESCGPRVRFSRFRR